MDGEHDDLVSLINQKLNALDNLQKLSDQMTAKLETSKKNFNLLTTRMNYLEKNNIGDVLMAIQTQGYIDISKRWRIGESNQGNGDLIFLDRTSTDNGKNSYYRFRAGVSLDVGK